MSTIGAAAPGTGRSAGRTACAAWCSPACLRAACAARRRPRRRSRRAPRPSPSRPAAGRAPAPIRASAPTATSRRRPPRRAGRRRSDSRATTPLALLSTRNTETPPASRWPPPVRAVTIRMGGPGRADHHRLVAVQHIAGAVLLGRGLQVGPVVAALRLGVGEGEDRLAGDDPADQRRRAGRSPNASGSRRRSPPCRDRARPPGPCRTPP